MKPASARTHLAPLDPADVEILAIVRASATGRHHAAAHRRALQEKACLFVNFKHFTPQVILESSWRYSAGGIDWYHTSGAPFDWTVTPQDTAFLFAPVDGETDPAGGGADVIYAGKGKDHAWGGVGNDVVFGCHNTESRRWRHGEQGLRVANEVQWRKQA